MVVFDSIFFNKNPEFYYRERGLQLNTHQVIQSWYSTGPNDFGQMWGGTENPRKHPKKVKHLQTEFVKFVSCGAHCTAAIAEPRDNDGTISTRRLWVWGQNQVIHVISLVHDDSY